MKLVANFNKITFHLNQVSKHFILFWEEGEKKELKKKNWREKMKE